MGVRLKRGDLKLLEVDSKLLGIPGEIAQNLSSLSLTGITNLLDEQLSKLLQSCQNLRPGPKSRDLDEE